MAKLKKYAKAYNIDVAGILEKDEFIDKLVAARVSAICLCLLRPRRWIVRTSTPTHVRGFVAVAKMLLLTRLGL